MTSDNLSRTKICVMNLITIKTPAVMKQLVILILLFVAYATQAQYGWNAPTQTSIAKRTVQFSYGGYTFTDELTLNLNDYYYYRGLSKTQPYSVYATESSTHPYLANLAKQLDADAKDLGYSGYTLAAYLTAFVQQAIPYRSDPYNGGYDYPRYPIETIIDQGGDCEDKAALLVALLNTFGFDAIMVNLPGHMAAAMSCSNCGGYYTYNGKKYSFIETTSSRGIGDVPYEYRNVNATLLAVATPTRYNRETTTTPPIDYSEGYWNFNNGQNGSGGNGNTWIYNGGSGSSYSTSTVTVNGTTYQFKGGGRTLIIVNGTNITITNY